MLHSRARVISLHYHQRAHFFPATACAFEGEGRALAPYEQTCLFSVAGTWGATGRTGHCCGVGLTLIYSSTCPASPIALPCMAYTLTEGVRNGRHARRFGPGAIVRYVGMLFVVCTLGAAGCLLQVRLVGRGDATPQNVSAECQACAGHSPPPGPPTLLSSPLRPPRAT